MKSCSYLVPLAASVLLHALSPAEALRPPSLESPSDVRAHGVSLPIQYSLEGEAHASPPAVAYLGVHATDLVIEFEVRGIGDAERTVARDDIAVFDAAAVEVFLGSTGDPSEGYYHISADPAGSIYDEVVRDGGWSRDPLWDAPVRASPVEAHESDAWALRMEIPLAILRRHLPDAPPAPAIPEEVWFQLAAASVPADGPAVAAAWQPASSTFHDPQAFARLSLSELGASPSAAVTTRFEMTDDGARIESALMGAETVGRPLRVEVELRASGITEGSTPLFTSAFETTQSPVEHRVPSDQLTTGRYLVTRVFDDDDNLHDQLVQDWLFRETSPVAALQERFRDVLTLRLTPQPADPVQRVWIERDCSVVWEKEPESLEPHKLSIDTAEWPAGPHHLHWESGSGTQSIPLGRVEPTAPPVAERWAFWGYAPDDEILAEVAAFAKITESGDHLAGFIYGGSIDPTTGALSALDLNSLRRWKEALPEAQMHLMIDGQGNFDLLDDETVASIAQRLVDDLMHVEYVDGLHFDLEPYRASQVRLTRKLTELGWTKPLSLATGLATTIPPEQWASIDFMVVMNYDLGRTPEVFARRASENARAFASAAAAHDSYVLIGLPVVATHNEYALVVEAATGEIVEETATPNMLPFVEPALQIFEDLANDETLADHVAAPVLWGALSRDQHIGLRRYRYFPTVIEGVVWERLVKFDRERANR